MRLRVSKCVKWSFIPSVVILLAGIISMCIFGVNLGIEFSGGTMYTAEMGEEFDIEKVTEIVRTDINDPTIDVRVSRSEDTQAIIQFQDAHLDGEEQNAVRALIEADLKTEYPDFEVMNLERNGATAGSELVTNALTAVAIACVLMLIYITLRFEFWSGIAALIGLLHDVLVMFAVILILRTQINSSFIAAILTIVGYSINNTIVIFDKIRTNKKLISSAFTRTDVADKSVSETLRRTLFTTITSLVMIVLLYAFGVTAIREFSLPIIVGLLTGFWSSVMLSTPIWLWLNKVADASRAKRAEKKTSRALKRRVR